MNGEEIDLSYLTRKELMPPDRAGVVWVDPLVTPDGRGYVDTYHRVLSDLNLVEGLK